MKYEATDKWEGESAGIEITIDGDDVRIEADGESIRLSLYDFDQITQRVDEYRRVISAQAA